jgi:hypothetical protein
MTELTTFESAHLHYRCFTLLILAVRQSVPARDGTLTLVFSINFRRLRHEGVITDASGPKHLACRDDYLQEIPF